MRMRMPVRWLRNRLGRLVVLAIVPAWLAGCGGGTSAGTSTQPATTVPPASLEQQYVAVVKQVQPQVAQIRTGSGLGSGVIFDTRGNIVTNAHVIAGGGNLVVTLADGHRYPATVVGAYAPDDLAVITIGPGRSLKPARFADSSKAEVGDIVLAAGNPLGLQSSITDGIVSALGRNVSEGQGIVLPNAIQTSAAINPGNSGGALVDLSGQVIGVPTLAAADPQLGGAASGIGFAIPSNTVRDIAGQIIQHGRVVDSHRAALGVSLADSLERPGALVGALQPGGPAERAGIVVGDAIYAIAGKDVANAEALATALAGLQPGQTVDVAITRPDGTSATVKVKLGELAGS